MDRHPPADAVMLERFLDIDTDLWPTILTEVIMAEAIATKCEHIRLADALLVLVFDRWERGILNKGERDLLVSRIYS